MAITNEHRKSAEKSMYGIYTMKGLTPQEKNQLFAESMAKKNAEIKKGDTKYNREVLTPAQKRERANKRWYSKYEKELNKSKEPSLYEKLTTGTDPRSENIDIKTPGQKEQIEELLNVLKGKWEPLLNDMEKSPRTAMNQQIEDWFSHMNNPIVQSMIGQGYRTNPQVLFPSELGQSDSSGQLNTLLSGLAQQYGPSAMQYGYDTASQYLPQAYNSAMGMAGQMGQYGQQMGGGLMDILSNLGNRFRSPQQPQG